jgi:serine/threonine protein kinase
LGIAPGTRIGPYEIVSSIGAGGMGEVYQASDARLGRKVAIKVLHTASVDAEHVRRFEQEARAAGMLSHPNILTIYDIGNHEGSPYIVSELLEGHTLRERLLDGPITVRKALDCAIQVARGLAAAHEKGIVHRDLKPENIFLLRDGRAKILDFGVAKLKEPAFAVTLEGPTIGLTRPGMVIGTASYMSPEQVVGRDTAPSSDLFSLGILLYEMVSAKRPFERGSAVEVMNAILKDEPRPLAEVSPGLPPALERVILHCMEKEPAHRFQSAHDLAFDLEMLAGVSVSRTSPAVAVPDARRKWLLPVAIAVLLALVAAAAFYAGTRTGSSPPPRYRQITSYRGTVWTARFAPDGRTVFYSAGWNGNPVDIYSMSPEAPESHSVRLPRAHLLAISSSGEMAILLKEQYFNFWFVKRGTLARLPTVGGTPRELIEDALEVDWSRDGTQLAVVRWDTHKAWLEYPMGKTLYETTGYISAPRISPDGEIVAFLDHPVPGDNRGWVVTVDRAGRKKQLSGEWSSLEGMAWAPRGSDIWFTATRSGEASALYGVTLSGRERIITRAPVSLRLHDVSSTGEVLLTGDSQSSPIVGLAPGDTKERDLSWLNWVRVNDLSEDGHALIFTQFGEGSGASYSTYLRKMDGSPAIKLGDGQGMKLSPDGRWALAGVNRTSLVLLPTGAGDVRTLQRGPIDQYADKGAWHPDGKRVLFIARERDRRHRCYIQGIDGPPRAITPEGAVNTGNPPLVSPDGKQVILARVDYTKYVIPLEGGEERIIPGLAADDMVAGWDSGGRQIYVYRRGELPIRVARLDVATGSRTPCLEITPSDAAGILGAPRVFLTPDGKSYVYTLVRHLSDLYLVDGLR